MTHQRGRETHEHSGSQPTNDERRQSRSVTEARTRENDGERRDNRVTGFVNQQPSSRADEQSTEESAPNQCKHETSHSEVRLIHRQRERDSPGTECRIEQRVPTAETASV